MTPLYIGLAIIVVLVLWTVFAYNRFVSMVQRGREAWADIDVQLKRRYDLIPNLIETVKGYATHEKTVLDDVTNARARAMGATSDLNQRGEAENMLSSTLKSLFAVAENYPDLKASANFLSLQEELATTENKVGFSRQFYNENVRALNTAVATIPSNLFAGIAKVGEREFYEVDDPQDRKAPKVTF